MNDGVHVFRDFDCDAMSLADKTSHVYRKQLAYVGKFHLQNAAGQRFNGEFTTKTFDHWLKTHRAMSAAGIDVPAPLDHSRSPEARRGTVVGLERGRDSKGREGLFALMTFRDADAEKMAKTSDVSIFVPPSFTDGKGRTYERPIRHVALTDYPVIPDLDKFRTIAASFASELDEDDDVLLAYNPDQPRDEQGRFSSSGAHDASKSASDASDKVRGSYAKPGRAVKSARLAKEAADRGDHATASKFHEQAAAAHESLAKYHQANSAGPAGRAAEDAHRLAAEHHRTMAEQHDEPKPKKDVSFREVHKTTGDTKYSDDPKGDKQAIRDAMSQGFNPTSKDNFVNGQQAREFLKTGKVAGSKENFGTKETDDGGSKYRAPKLLDSKTMNVDEATQVAQMSRSGLSAKEQTRKDYLDHAAATGTKLTDAMHHERDLLHTAKTQHESFKGSKSAGGGKAGGGGGHKSSKKKAKIKKLGKGGLKMGFPGKGIPADVSFNDMENDQMRLNELALSLGLTPADDADDDSCAELIATAFHDRERMIRRARKGRRGAEQTISASLVNLVRDNRTSKIDGLAREGFLTKPARDELVTRFCSDDALSLCLSHDGEQQDDGFDGTLALLKKNGKVVRFGDKSGPQALNLAHKDDDAGDNPLTRDADKRAKAAAK